MPRIDSDKLVARLASGKAVPAVLLLGDDAYLRDTVRAALLDKLVPEGARDWGVTRLSLREASLGDVLRRAQTMPMLASHQVICVSDLEMLQGRVESAAEDVEEDVAPKDPAKQKSITQLEEYLADAAPFTTLVFEAPQIDQRMKLAKLLMEKALVVAVSIEEGSTSPATLVALARRIARDAGAEIEAEAAEDLVDLCDGQLSRMRTELQKLAAYVAERKRITAADVDALVVSEKKYSIWQLAEMLASRQRGRALEFLGGVLREGDEPAGIIGALAWMYRTLIQVQEMPRNASVWDVVRQLHIRKETAETALAAAPRIPRAQLLLGVETLYEADSRLKSGPADPRAVLEFVIAQLTAPAAQSKPA